VEESLFDQFVANAERLGYDAYRETISGSGGFEYRDVVENLMELENKLNSTLLVNLFGEKLGMHYATVFAIDCNRNLLRFMGKMESEKRFFLLQQVKTNSYKLLTAYPHT